MTRVNLNKLMQEAYTLERAAYEDKEVTKRSNLRAGNSGLMDKDGNAFVSCPRRAYLRSEGIEIEPPSTDRLIMFDGGTLNETMWVNKLVQSWKGTILTEEEIPTIWQTSNGTNVTGRPDIVLCEDDGKPVHGLELKTICSLWTARDAVFTRKPKMGHLVQAAHYMWQLGVPFDLVYTQYVDFPTPVYRWAVNSFPLPGEPGSEFCEYNKQGNLKKILPSIQIYNLNFMDGTLYYRHSDDTEYKPTVITIDAIERYYEGISKTNETGNLPSPPSNIDVDGSPMKWNLCDYCPLDTGTCIGSKSLTKWLDYIKSFNSNGTIK